MFLRNSARWVVLLAGVASLSGLLKESWPSSDSTSSSPLPPYCCRPEAPGP